MAYIKIAEDGRVTAASKTHHCGEGEIEMEIPEEIDIETIHEYRFESGEFIHDPKVTEPVEPKPTTAERIAALELENKQLKEALDLLLSGETEEGADDNA